MLTAQLNTGEEICLGYEIQKEVLLSLRKKEEFFCPVCGERVLLKLGDQRIYHFAHVKGGTCRNFYDSESIYHLEGKRQLFQWLLQQKIPAKLEFYDKAIQQRPDVVFFYEGEKYALEFQCSVIPEEIFMKRTKTYIENGYTPIWILAGKQIQQKKPNIWPLSNFHYLFLKETTEGKFYIPAYIPDKRLFHFIGPIHSYSVKNAFAPYSLNHAAKMNVKTLLHPELKNPVEIEPWHNVVDKYHFHWSLHKSPEQSRFLHEIYRKNLNPFLLPPEIGLPVSHSLFIENSPIIWQTYLYLDVLAKKQPGECISIHEIESSMRKRIARKEVIIRNLPQFKVNPILAVVDYLQELTWLGLLIKTGDKFEMTRNFNIPKSNSEGAEYKRLFYQKYYQLLRK